MRDGQRYSTAKGYLVPAENRKNLDIVANAFVTKVFSSLIIQAKKINGILRKFSC